MKNITLYEILLSQDMGEKNAQKITDQLLDNTFDANKDPISAIVANAFVENEYIEYDGMEMDLKHAINQLTKALQAIQNRG